MTGMTKRSGLTATRQRGCREKQTEAKLFDAIELSPSVLNNVLNRSRGPARQMSLKKAETPVQNSNTATSGRAPKRIGKIDIPTPRDT
jgi:hypothetical protein